MSKRDPYIGKCLYAASIGHWWRHRWRHVTRWLILATSQCSKLSHSETRTRINYPCGTFKQAHYRSTLRLKNDPIQLRTIEEACGATALPPKFGDFHVSMPLSALQRAAHNKLVCIGGVKLAGLDRVLFSFLALAPDHTRGSVPGPLVAPPHTPIIGSSSALAFAPTTHSNTFCDLCYT